MLKAKQERKRKARPPKTRPISFGALHRPHPAPLGLRRLVATALPKLGITAAPRGRLVAGGTSYRCALGAGAIRQHKKEGDGASPAGQFRLLGGYFRPIGARPLSPWPLRAIRPGDGWCDDPHAPAYNRPQPFDERYSCEKLWRDDGLYDLVVVLDYNFWPRRKGKGSAIFLHCAGPDFAPTAGCIALRADDLRKLLPRLAADAVLVVR